MSNKLTTSQIRNEFLNHMKANGHMIIKSSPLVPENDPTTLFTGSGMQPMVPYLLGQPHPLGKRIADSQKCFRSQDIEEVGDNRHTTFFEMLGNWSLGNFFKEEQIDIMWDFLINKIKLDPTRLYFSVYRGNEKLNINRDEVSIKKWQEKFNALNIESKVGITPEVDGMQEGERIFTYSDKKNWWSRSGVPENMPIGEPGGPDTEMFFDFDPDLKLNIHAESQYNHELCHPNCDCGRFVEIGNNVFMQYKKTENGVEELSQKNVDFGGGLERMAAAVNDDSDVFNIDVFDKAKKILENISGQNYISDTKVTFTDITNPTFAYRVILDHIRAATFLIADGVVPGNKDQMYFVRRLVRRAVRYARNLNINNNFISKVAEAYIEYYKDEYPELEINQSKILEELDKEENKFRKTLESGIDNWDKIFYKLRSTKNFMTGDVDKEVVNLINSKFIFDMYQNSGFPSELSFEEIKSNIIEIDKSLPGDKLSEYLMRGDFQSVNSIYVTFNLSEWFKNLSLEFNKLKDEHASASRTASAGKFKGGLGGDGETETKYHTATHILHQALKMVLGENVQQKGSNITTERLRFDFAFDRKMTDEEKKKVEDIVNEAIKCNYPMIREEISYEEARNRGAIGLFDDKYGEKVSVYHMGVNSIGKNRGDEGLFSIEFCGGPHVESTGNMGVFKITKEEAVSQGVRRIKAILE